jgi:hypothetical protein
MEVCNVRKRYLVAAAIVLVVAVLAIGTVVAGAGSERDKVAPTATTDTAPLYWNDVAISAAAADAAGIAYVYYEFDGAVMRVAKVDGAPAQAVVPLQVTPADVVLPSPDPSVTPQPHEVNDPSAGGKHMLTYWAQDVWGNVGPRQTVTYKVGKDTAAPESTVSGVVDGGWYHTFALVTLTTADVGESGVASFEYSADGGAPVRLAGPKPRVTVPLAGDVESRSITYGATDVAGNVEAAKTVTVHFDNVAPTVKTWDATVRKGARATLKFQVSDAAPNGGTAAVVIKIRKYGRGTVAKTIESVVPVNVSRTARFRCTLARGSYVFTVAAADTAGNTAVPTRAAIGELVVR